MRSRHTPLDLGMPWWSFGAANAVAGLLKESMEVFEFGSGGSTVFLARKVMHLTCVEDSEEWIGSVSAEVRRSNLSNVNILARPFDFGRTEEFESSSYLNALQGRSYDLIVVDGQEHAAKVRPQCFWRAERFIRPGGVIVLDDSWRYPEVKQQNKASRFKDYKGVGCCRLGVTSTCLFFY
jgi:predicted O-methyltransferase YrrM